MKKLIKAYLSGILRLTGAYQAVKAPDVEREVAILQSSRHTDYFFLAWKGRCRLSTLPAVYEPDTPANLDWLAYRGVTPWPVVALYLHTDKSVERHIENRKSAVRCKVEHPYRIVKNI
ncbi:hypothetical protein, partial [Oscillibacter sp. CU971]|uniref:hypothetical protein n=1 Tax=Oscillibacter sp. CU971 TaxID=2780102 RepID=UPI0035B1A71E